MKISYQWFVLLPALMFCAAGNLAAEVCSALWIGGAGNWTNAANWDITGDSCGSFPNNGSGITYDVDITFGTATADSPALVIDTLFIRGSGTVDIVSGGELGVAGRTGASCAGICNDGQLKISGGDLVLTGRVEYSGAGTVPVSATGVSRIVQNGPSGTRLTVLPGSTLNIVSQGAERGFLHYEARLTNAGTLNQQNVEMELCSSISVNSGAWTVDGQSVLEDSCGGFWNNTDGTLTIADGGLLQTPAEIQNGTLAVADGARVEVINPLLLSGVSSSGSTGTFEIHQGLGLSDAAAFRAGEVILLDGASLDGDETSAWEVSGNETLKVSGNSFLDANVLGTGLEITRLNPASTDFDQLTINANIQNGEFTIFGGLPVWLPSGSEIELTRLLITDGASLTVNGGRLIGVPGGVVEVLGAGSSLTVTLGGTVQLLSLEAVDDGAIVFQGANGLGFDLAMGIASISGTLQICGPLILQAGTELQLDGGTLRSRSGCSAAIGGDGRLTGSGDIEMPDGSLLEVPAGQTLNVAFGLANLIEDGGDFIVHGLMQGSVESFLDFRGVFDVCGTIDLVAADGDATVRAGALKGFTMANQSVHCSGAGSSTESTRRVAADAGRTERTLRGTGGVINVHGGALLELKGTQTGSGSIGNPATVAGGTLQGTIECERCVLDGVTNQGDLGVRFASGSLDPTMLIIEGGALHNQGVLRLPAGGASVNSPNRIELPGPTVIDGEGLVLAKSVNRRPHFIASSTATSEVMLTNEDNLIQGGAFFGETQGATVGLINEPRGRIEVESRLGVAGLLDNRGEIVNGVDFADLNVTTAVNSGMIRFTDPFGGAEVFFHEGLTNTGRLEAQIIRAQPGFPLNIDAGRVDVLPVPDNPSQMRGNVTLGAGELDIGGTTVNVLNVEGSYTQSAGRLNIDVAANDQDFLFVSNTFSPGNVGLGGDVWIRAIPGFEPAPGDRFTFLQYTDGRFGTEFDQAINGTPYLIGFDLEYDDVEKTVTAIVTEADPGPDLSLTATVLAKGPGGKAEPGTEVDFIIDVQHSGGTQASDVVIIDTLPDGLTFQSATLQGNAVMQQAGIEGKTAGTAIACQDDAGVVSCPVGNMVQGDQLTVTITALIATAQDGDSVVNQVSVTAAEIDPIPFDNSAQNEFVIGEHPEDVVFADRFE